MHCALFEAIVRAEVNRTGVHSARHLNVVICDFAFMLPPDSAFCSNHDRMGTCWGVLNQRLKRRLFENKHGLQLCFALTTFENADFGLKS